MGTAGPDEEAGGDLRGGGTAGRPECDANDPAGGSDAPAEALAYFPDTGNGVQGRIQQPTERPVRGQAGRIPRDGEVGLQQGARERIGDRDEPCGAGGGADGECVGGRPGKWQLLRLRRVDECGGWRGGGVDPRGGP